MIFRRNFFRPSRKNTSCVTAVRCGAKTFSPTKLEDSGTDYIIAVETKSNGDDSEENKAKYKFAKEHFVELNKQLAEKNVKQKYIFHFVCPDDFPTFFDYLRSSSLIEGRFYGQLEELLGKD